MGAPAAMNQTSLSMRPAFWVLAVRKKDRWKTNDDDDEYEDLQPCPLEFDCTWKGSGPCRDGQHQDEGDIKVTKTKDTGIRSCLCSPNAAWDASENGGSSKNGRAWVALGHAPTLRAAPMKPLLALKVPVRHRGSIRWTLAVHARPSGQQRMPADATRDIDHLRTQSRCHIVISRRD